MKDKPFTLLPSWDDGGDKPQPFEVWVSGNRYEVRMGKETLASFTVAENLPLASRLHVVEAMLGTLSHFFPWCEQCEKAETGMWDLEHAHNAMIAHRHHCKVM